jgi:hypothetical protein
VLHHNDHADFVCLVGIVDAVDNVLSMAARRLDNPSARRREIEES